MSKNIAINCNSNAKTDVITLSSILLKQLKFAFDRMIEKIVRKLKKVICKKTKEERELDIREIG